MAAYACKEACAVNKKISRILKTNVTLYMLCLALFVLAAIPVDLRLAIGEAVMAILVYVLCRKRSRSTQQLSLIHISEPTRPY